MNIENLDPHQRISLHVLLKDLTDPRKEVRDPELPQARIAATDYLASRLRQWATECGISLEATLSFEDIQNFYEHVTAEFMCDADLLLHHHCERLQKSDENIIPFPEPKS